MNVRTWTENLSVGYTEMDRQHKHLFAQLNHLADAADDMPLTLQALNRLGDAMFDHFASEERYMAAMSYPELNSHRLEHRSFGRLFAKIMMRIQSNPSMESAQEAHQTLGDWMTRHLFTTDARLGKFLAGNMALQPAGS
jgi:hemerythrin